MNKMKFINLPIQENDHNGHYLLLINNYIEKGTECEKF